MKKANLAFSKAKLAFSKAKAGNWELNVSMSACS
jgi:hypothetical protein